MATIWDKIKEMANTNYDTENQALKTAISTAQNTASKPITSTVAAPAAPSTTKDYYEIQYGRLNQPYVSGTTPTVNQIMQNGNTNNGSSAGNNQPALTIVSGTGKSSGSATSSADAYYNAYSQAIARQEAAYKQREEAAAKQRDERKKALEQQNEAMKKQREATLADSLEANNKAADKSLNEAYVAYMLSKRNLAQQLKALGISGGGSETVVTDMSNTYANSRFGIEDGRNTANAAARRNYDSGINSDYMDYLSALAKIDSAYNDKIYSLAGDKASTLSSLAKSAQSTASKSTATAKSAATPTVKYRIDSLGIAATDEVDVYNQLIAKDYTPAQAEQLMIGWGILAKPVSAGRSER